MAWHVPPFGFVNGAMTMASRWMLLLRPSFTLASSIPLRSTSSSSSSRPTLDDVERLSRGKSSRAKLGSRSIPHRLNAEERKAYELAKKKGYLVRQVWTRRYPLSNTFRNYCDALGWPCLRIDQGQAGSLDTIVLDLSTLRLDIVDLATLQVEICRSVQCKLSSRNIDEVKSGNSCINNEQQLNIEGQKIRDVLTFQLLRSEAQHACQLIQECCKAFLLSKRPLS